MCLNIKIWSQVKTNVGDFQPLEVVGCGSETQLQVSAILNDLL